MSIEPKYVIITEIFELLHEDSINVDTCETEKPYFAKPNGRKEGRTEGRTDGWTKADGCSVHLANGAAPFGMSH